MTVMNIDKQADLEAQIVARLQGLQGKMLEQDDRERAGQYAGLLKKWESKQFYLAFCGHFSAGKSTLINKLCGHPLLPSSPIPTSANIVSIANGDAGAVVYQHEPDREQLAPKEVPMDELAQYCVDGKDIERVEIRYPLPLLGEHAVLLDTPGIDSTDDAHQLATESALYLADIVFYVMDYNHVQSEMNLAFAKKMKERGKPLYLIINMIDKHREEELSFEAYRAGVDEAYRAWGVEPDGVLYVSMKAPRHPRSEWNKLRALIAQLIARGEAFRAYSVDEAARQLLEEHRAARAEVHAPRKAELREALGESGAALVARREELLREAEAAKQEPQRLLAALRSEAVGIIDNANITPAVTRDVAHHYLQSRVPGFKAGFFARAAQTAAEIERRLLKLHADFTSNVAAQLERHLQTMLRQAMEQATAVGDAPELLAAIESVHMDITPEWLAGQVNTAAVFGNEYTMNYMKQTAMEVKSDYRRKVFEVIDLLFARLQEAAAETEHRLGAELQELDSKLANWDELKRMERQEAEEDAELYALAGTDRTAAPDLPDLDALSVDLNALSADLGSAADDLDEGSEPSLHQADIDVVLQASHTFDQLNEDRSVTGDEPETPFVQVHHAEQVKQRADAYLDAAREMEELPALKSIARSLADKAKRLQNQTYTIALFGAFSAGKSSFANALIGERVLPVSPNPTTAAINRIRGPLAEWPHGTAKVTMKRHDALLEDVLYSLEVLGEQASDMPSALAVIDTLSPERVSAKGKPHYSFLLAVKKGWTEAESILGQQLKVDHAQFTDYVADESKSCFVHEIELYYSSPLTDQGIVFVDTPGADSINARHTGVAFNYIKNADAILFVTYYNHAFSQADKQFLLQLGRVKETFELDKMFFIVNAADLASSEEELEGVVRHVESNLLAHGIRHPRIYPISSQRAAEGKLEKNSAVLHASGILPFERDFSEFAFHELSQMALQSAESELKRGLHTLERWIADMQTSEENRLKRIAQLKEKHQQGEASLAEADYTDSASEMAKEVQELLYYVKQRTMYRYSELFNAAFNPAVFREEGKSAKELIQSAWDDLKRMFAFELEQEGLATTLRIEKALNALSAKQYNRWGGTLQAIMEGFEYEAYTARSFPTPDISVSFEADNVSVKWLQGFYKNNKQFFEADGRTKLKNELEGRVGDAVTEALAKLDEDFIRIYNEYLRSWLDELRERQRTTYAEHMNGTMDALEMKADFDQLDRKRTKLAQLVHLTD